jgi:hypothetical protein
MPQSKHPILMTAFTKEDVDHLLADLQLYSGSIREIGGLYDLHTSGIGSFGGKIHTWTDAFTFSAVPVLCDEESWAICLVDPVQSIRCGGSIQPLFRFPKLHKDAALQEKYAVANLLYKAYHSCSNVTEASRLPRYENVLGYEVLSSYQCVLDAIVRDFRSFQQRKLDDAKSKYTKN